MSKTVIIRTDDHGEMVVDVLQDGYNIIERTAYNVGDEAAALLKAIEEEFK